MPCPICDHTMQNIEKIIFWCPRCGTVKTVEQEQTTHYTPALIERCKEFELTLGPMWKELWSKLGIFDSIHMKEN